MHLATAGSVWKDKGPVTSKGGRERRERRGTGQDRRFTKKSESQQDASTGAL